MIYKKLLSLNPLKVIRILKTVFFLLGISVCSIAQEFSLYEKDIKYNLTNQLQYIGDYAIESITNLVYNTPQKITTTNQKTINKKLDPLKWHWSEIILENKSTGKHNTSDWILEFNQLVTHIKIFAVYKNGKIEEHNSGLFLPLDKKTTHHTFRSSICKIRVNPNENTKLIIGLFSERPSLGVVSKTTIESYFNYTKRISKSQRGNSFFNGFILLMALYNLMLFLINRDKAYFYYSIYLFSICLFSLYKNGILADNLFNYILAENPKYNYLGKYFGYLMLGSYLFFLRYFLELKTLLPTWDKIFKYLIYLAVPMAAIDFTLLLITNFSPAVSDIPAFAYATIIVFLSIIFCFKLYHTKNIRGYFIVAGLTAMSAGLLATIIYRIITIEFTLTPFKYGSLIEVLLFSLGLAYRQREFEREKQESELALEKANFLQKLEKQESQRLREIDQLKTKFFSNISHEFRTPLSIIIGMAENISDKKVKSLIESNANNLLRLINQVLNISKIENEKESINYIKSDLINYANYLTESFYSNARTKNIKLEFKSSVHKLDIYFDKQKIQQILYNLISNAIKYSEQNDSVTICIDQNVNKTEVKISVNDTGIGIDQEHLPFVFDRYFRVESNDKKIFEGTGIGLALTKELINLLNGNISIISEVGQGTNVTVTLPIIRNLPIDNNPEVNLEGIVNSTNDSNQENQTDKEDKNVVLIVEDNEDLSNFIKSILEKEFICFVAKNGHTGINCALKLIPDVIISDVMMPQKDGYELVDTLKNNKFTSHIPIILLTAKADFKSKIQGLKHGADAYMTKPFVKNELLLRVSNMITLIKSRQVRFSILDNNSENDKNSTTENTEDQFLIDFKAFLIENIKDENLSILDFCQNLNISKSQLFRKIKATTGSTPGKLLKELRMDAAKNIFSKSDKSIKEVAFDVGFNDPGYFSKVYKNYFGESPKRP